MKIQKDMNNCCEVPKEPEAQISKMIKNCTFGDYDRDLLTAAKHGDADAQVVLAELYEDDAEFDKAYYWLKLAAKKGGLQALDALANLSLQGPKFGNPCELYTKLLEQATTESESGYRRKALAQLGHCYEYGLGCEKDLDKALEYYKRGAVENALMCNEAAGNILFERGDYKEALACFLREKTLFSKSLLRLAEMYEHGLGTNVDLYKAKMYYQMVRRQDVFSDNARHANEKLQQPEFSRIRLKPSDDCDYVTPFAEVYTCSEEIRKRYPLTAESFFRYFTTDFPTDFNIFFYVDYDFGSHKLKFVDCYNRPGINERPRVSLHFPNHAIFFTVGVFYASLIPQAIGVVCGSTAMINAYKASGVPFISSTGLYYPPSPIWVLQDSGLLRVPDDPECQQLFEMVHPLMRKLLDSYLFDKRRPTLYPDALTVLQREAAPHAAEIWHVCEQHLADMKRYLADCQVGYPVKLYDKPVFDLLD